MTDSISTAFINMDTKTHWAADKRLDQLADYIDYINDPKIKMFVKFLLSKAEAFWVVPAEPSDRDNLPPDEHLPGGMLRNARRAARSFVHLSGCMNFTTEELDCGVAALILRNVTKAWSVDLAQEAEIVYDPFYLYTIDSYIDRCMTEAQLNFEDTGNILGILEESLTMITHLIHTSDGFYSIIPETFPMTALEKTVHMATVMGALCYDIYRDETVKDAE